MLSRPFTRPLGFSLTELAVVLVIVALLLGGLLVPFATQRDVEAMRATEKSLSDIRDALIGFAAIYGRLPCPAQGTIASGSANAGVEATMTSGGITYCACSASTGVGIATVGSIQCKVTADSDSVAGVLPWATLGLLEPDGWGYRYTYHVSTFFARGINSAEILFGTGCTPSPNPPVNASFGLCTPGAIVMYSAASGGTLLADTGKVAAVVVSHGGNHLGAYTSSGTKLASTGATADEAQNVDGDATYVSNSGIDDRLIWLSTTQLMSRMMSAGKLP